MIGEFLNALAGLVVGIVTGFYFERRATLSARQENDRLRRELASLRDSVYNMGTVDRDSVTAGMDSLFDSVILRARAIQDPEGKVLRSKLISHFLALGHSLSEINDVLDRCIDKQLILREGKWIKIP